MHINFFYEIKIDRTDKVRKSTDNKDLQYHSVRVLQHFRDIELPGGVIPCRISR